MSRKKSKKIPRPYRKPLSEQKFKKLSAAVSDSTERKKLQKAFPLGDDKKYHYQEPGNKKEVDAVSLLLKKVHKEKTGPRTIRLTILIILIAAPILFNLVFLDRIAARYLEKGLEDLTETDVGVGGLDIAILSGRFSLETLSFASKTDSMKNEVEFNGLIADLDISPLFFRRVVFNTLEGGLGIGTPRDEEAVYPVEPEAADGGTSGVSADTFSPFLDLISDSVVPDESVLLARQLNKEAQEVFESWSENLSDDYSAAEDLSRELEDFMSEPLPDNSDVAGWLAKVEEGKRLAEEIEGQRRIIENYRRDLTRDAGVAQNALNQAKAALANDLAKIESALAFDDQMINGWIEAAIRFYAGPGIAEIYTRISALSERSSDRSDKEKAVKPKSGGRMERGRIVFFPVKLPPRFSIRNLDLSGEGITLAGENVGVDHDLAGEPSRLELLLEGFEGVEGMIAAEVIVDGRSSAETLIDAAVIAEGWTWTLENEDLNGMLAIDAAFSLSERVNGSVTSRGAVELFNWAGNVEAGGLSFINEDSPPLGFAYTYISASGDQDLSIELDRQSVNAWGAMIAGSALSAGKESARKALMESVDADISGLEATIAGWDKEKTVVDNLASQLASDEFELENKINEWTKKSAGSLPVPEATKVLEGLGSLF